MAERTVWVDGVERSLDAEDFRHSLAWWLRDGGSTSVKVGCEEGICGSCAVLLDGQAAPSCVVSLGRVPDGTRIETAGGVSADPAGRAVVDALAAEDALQCGFCAAGMTMTCVGWLREHGSLPSNPAELRGLLSSHVCRCTGQLPIVDALCGVSLESDAR